MVKPKPHVYRRTQALRKKWWKSAPTDAGLFVVARPARNVEAEVAHILLLRGLSISPFVKAETKKRLRRAPGRPKGSRWFRDELRKLMRRHRLTAEAVATIVLAQAAQFPETDQAEILGGRADRLERLTHLLHGTRS